ncbi:winged helix-turn-helix transcriptional regulator [Candidatus Micrarchaeota archaeon]|nr:winged helix-turn-helix transcriptional regulator [Candidatus Micrarchaeota archaeon]
MRKFLLICLLFAAVVFSTNLYVANILDGSGHSYLSMEVSGSSSSLSGKPLTIRSNALGKIVSVKDGSGIALSFENGSQNGLATITTIVPYNSLDYYLESDSLTSKNGTLWLYRFELGSDTNLSLLVAKVLLPKGATLRSTNGQVTSSGDQLSIEWEFSNLLPNQRALMTASYDIDQTPVSDSNSFFLIGGSIILIILVAGFFYLSKEKPVISKPTVPTSQSSPPQESLTVPTPIESPKHLSPNSPSLDTNPVFKTLDQTDQDIVRYLVSKGGTTTQADLNLNTHIPKATLSRRIASLESKGIIQKSQKGIRNLVSLTNLIDTGRGA